MKMKTKTVESLHPQPHMLTTYTYYIISYQLPLNCQYLYTHQPNHTPHPRLSPILKIHFHVLINCCSTDIKVFQRNGYVYMYTMQSYMHSECALWKSSIWPGQRSCTWPIFQLHPTHDLKYICAKFHHSTSNHSWVMGKTDRQTDIQDDRIKHSYGILNEK